MFISDLFPSSSSEIDESSSAYSDSDIDPDYVAQANNNSSSSSDENSIQVVPALVEERTPGKHEIKRKEKTSKKQAKSPELWNKNKIKKRRNSG